MLFQRYRKLSFTWQYADNINYGQINLRFCEMIKLKIIQTLEKNPISVDEGVLFPLYMIVINCTLPIHVRKI